MTQLNITIDSDQIQTLISKCAANELAKDILALVFNQIMEQRADYIKAEHLFIKKYESNPKLSKACQTLDDGFENAIQILQLPENIQRRLKTTNCLERLNQEICRRERVI